MTYGKSFQMINEEAKFCDHLQDFLNYRVYEQDIKIISVIGPQSSGKSTILNCLFDTDFAIREPEAIGTQTTLGIWVQSSSEGKLILDCEGSDSIQRNADESFEKKFGLMSFVLSDILFVNIWYSDIGRRDASNIPLLESVFEANLKYFAASKTDLQKTTLLVLIRDFSTTTDIEQSKKATKLQIEEIFQDLWKNIVEKFDEWKHINLKDMFDLRILLLPHYSFFREEFVDECDNIKVLLNDIVNNCQMTRKLNNVPFRDTQMYFEETWEKIMNNEDFNLPRLKNLLARVKADENMQKKKVQITAIISGSELHFEPKVIFEECMKVLEEFDELMDGYDKDAVIEYHDKLKEYIDVSCLSVFQEFCEKIFKEHFANFSTEIFNCQKDFENQLRFVDSPFDIDLKKYIESNIDEDFFKLLEDKLNEQLIDGSLFIKEYDLTVKNFCLAIDDLFSNFKKSILEKFEDCVEVHSIQILYQILESNVNFDKTMDDYFDVFENFIQSSVLPYISLISTKNQLINRLIELFIKYLKENVVNDRIFSLMSQKFEKNWNLFRNDWILSDPPLNLNNIDIVYEAFDDAIELSFSFLNDTFNYQFRFDFENISVDYESLPFVSIKKENCHVFLNLLEAGKIENLKSTFISSKQNDLNLVVDRLKMQQNSLSIFDDSLKYYVFVVLILMLRYHKFFFHPLPFFITMILLVGFYFFNKYYQIDVDFPSINEILFNIFNLIRRKTSSNGDESKEK
eukprot:TRINITY_DN3121_c2_g1_i1.p1 TRINITY_DN3121_c2_g1~~TRINITY_DN3121_c2_g1_i1.p1  ORF type:complete len:741 (+),score=247.87 TRINITY_DN3121_c2_g1_i1:54-2276(+)